MKEVDLSNPDVVRYVVNRFGLRMIKNWGRTSSFATVLSTISPMRLILKKAIPSLKSVQVSEP